MVKETLEEAAERLLRSNINEVNSFIRIGAFKFGVKLGAKWQAERMYSEEELQQKIDAHLEVAKDLWLSTIKEQKRMYSEEEVKKLLISCKDKFSGGDLEDYHSDSEVIEWFKKKK